MRRGSSSAAGRLIFGGLREKTFRAGHFTETGNGTRKASGTQSIFFPNTRGPLLAGNAVLDWIITVFLLGWTPSVLNFYFYGTVKNHTLSKPQLFHPHAAILCIHDAMTGFCCFNSLTCCEHYKDNIEVLNRQRFAEKPVKGSFPWGGRGRGGRREEEGWVAVCFLYFYC